MSKGTAACVAEGVGAFALSFIGAGVICMDAKMGAGGPGLLGIAIAHGLILSIAVSAAMNISGGHINPAVTVAMLVTGRVKGGTAISYIVSQCIGATVAGLLVAFIFSGMKTGSGAMVAAACNLGTPNYNPAELSMAKAILIEAFLTFLLVFAIFGTAVDPRAPKLGGFAIGLTIACDILLGGPLTGGAMNPSRTFGPGIVAAFGGNLSTFWQQQPVYWIGPCVGAVLAAFIYDAFIMEKRPA